MLPILRVIVLMPAIAMISYQLHVTTSIGTNSLSYLSIQNVDRQDRIADVAIADHENPGRIGRE